MVGKMDATRRATLGGLAAASLAGVAPAHAAVPPRSVTRHPAFRPWKLVYDPDPAPLDVKVTTVAGETVPLRSWIGKGPTVLVLWATWCGPCVAEKPSQAKLQRQLTYMRSTSKIKCVQAYDPRPLEAARAGLDRMGCTALETARATPEFERAFVDFFGASPRDPSRTSLPSLVLLGPDGTEVGRAEGALTSYKGQSYWSDAVTQQFIGTLDRLLLER